MTDQPRASIAINPGSGRVAESTEQNAIANMAVLLDDLRTRSLNPSTFVRRAEADYGDGRYAFNVLIDDANIEVQMPGLPIDQVRWLKSEGQDIWQFPRLYIDDSSWVWYFALDQFAGDDAPRRWPDGTVTGGEIIQFSSGSDA